MRVAVVVCALLVARVALADDAATFDATLTTAAGFDHVRHDGKVQVHGGGALACDACHALDPKGRLKGKPGHAQCFGACHGAAPAKKRPKVAYVVPAAQGNVCAACHAPSALAALTSSARVKTVKAAYPPFRIDPDFGLALSHQKHDAAGAACSTCHASERPAGGRGHDRCSRCHLAPKAATTPSMTACTQCHAAAWGPARSPELVASPLGLGPSFSHAAHAKVARAAVCTSCHGAVTTTTGHDIPAPRTEDCRQSGCHDGKVAFSTTEACTRCHTGAPTGTVELVRPTARFSHDRHRARLGGVTCASCHTLDRRGEATPPAHAACSTLGCHREDFATPTPMICGACHVAIEPWRPLRADALPLAETEFGARMRHRDHADRGLRCSGCHSIADARRELRPPRGHVACSGTGGCHTADQRSAKPALTDCEQCHALGHVPSLIDARLGERWSVRARFRHDVHPGECESCHAGVWQSRGTPEPPAKKDCAACHDGKAAFKMTGHGCRRCHGS
jgi:c(7)-type cytochrome triheme protein